MIVTRMSHSNGDAELMSLVERFRMGDGEAAREIHRRFAEGLLQRIRSSVSGSANRSALDSEGILQEGFRSFFSEIGKPGFEADPNGSIAGLLTTIVVRKAAKHARKPVPQSLAPDELSRAAAGLVADLSVPEAEAVLHEAVAAVLDRTTKQERGIIERLLACRSIDEIAAQSHLSRNTVEETVDRFMGRLRNLAERGD